MKRSFSFLILIIIFLTPDLYAQDQEITKELGKGRTLAAQCINCHNNSQAALADPLQGIRKIRSANYIYRLIKNPMQFADENKKAKKVFAKRGTQMPPFPDLSKTDIEAIFDYIDSLPLRPEVKAKTNQ